MFFSSEWHNALIYREITSDNPWICKLRDLNNSKQGLKSHVEVISQTAANALFVTNGTIQVWKGCRIRIWCFATQKVS